MAYGQSLKAMGGMSFTDIAKTAGRMELMLITPEMAAKWLGMLYKRQRKENSNAKAIYLKSMGMGHWKVSNDAITITKDGECINGQHRLMAIVDNNEPIVAWVLLDASPDMYDIIDNSYARSAAQVLDCPNANNVAAIAKALVTLEAGESFGTIIRSTRTVPRWMIAERAESDMDYLQQLTRTSRSIRYVLSGGSSTAYAIALHLFNVVNDGFDVQEAATFVNDGDATTLALQRFIGRKMQGKDRMSPEVACGTLLQFLEAKVSGKTVKQFKNQDVFNRRYHEAYTEKVSCGD